jgi:serine/threonine protein phosphatase PrpC
VYADISMKTPIATSFLKGEAVVFSQKSPAKDSVNEDSCAHLQVSKSQGVLAVADGMGGRPAGEAASKLALVKLEESLAASKNDDKDLRYSILNGFELANQCIQSQTNGSGTTLAVVEIDGHNLRPYHAGDSVIMVVGGRGKIKMQTVPHSSVGYALESGLLDENQAFHHEDRHFILNSVGSSDMRVEIGSSLQLAQKDTVLIASDGLSDNLRAEEMATIIRKGPLLDAGLKLALLATQRMAGQDQDNPGKADDLTFILYRLRI